MASIHLENVSVSFPIYSASSRSFKNRFISTTTGGRLGLSAARYVCIQALDDITLNIEHGDRLGLVGHNGAGKTTLLRVLAGIYEPAVGSARISGRVAPLFDVGLGMEAESSGYDNIILRGIFLGLSREEIQAKVDEIAEFTELEGFLHMPLRTYSTGMRARLTFAVSTSINPEILLLDEGIGTGDAAFIKKAQERLESFTQRAGSFFTFMTSRFSENALHPLGLR